jgi:hypothetical protein
MSNPWEPSPDSVWSRQASENLSVPPTHLSPHPGASPPHGSFGVPTLPPPDPPKQGVLKRGWRVAMAHPWWSGVGALGTVIGIVVAIVIAVADSPPTTQQNVADRCSASGSNISINCSGSQSSTPQQPGVTPVNSKPPSDSPLQLTTVWPWVSGCPAIGSAIAMPVGGGSLQDFHSPRDLTPTFIANGAGSWIQGSMYLHFQAAPGKHLEIVDIKPHVQRRDLAAPAWVFIEQSGCGPYPGDRRFVLNLDQPLLTDEGVESGPNQKPNAPTASLGTGFVVDNQNDTQIRLDTLSCKGNYQWTLEVQYMEVGTTGIKSYEIGPMTSYGRADNTVRYVGDQNASGTVNVKDQQTITGEDPSYLGDKCGH